MCLDNNNIFSTQTVSLTTMYNCINLIFEQNISGHSTMATTIALAALTHVSQ